MLYTFIDNIFEQAQEFFGYTSGLDVDTSLRLGLLEFQAQIIKADFDSSRFFCQVCLENKQGSDCYKLARCGHVFCKDCLIDGYTHAIKEGNVQGVGCMGAGCHIVTNHGQKVTPTLPPAELLEIPLGKDIVQRYAEMQRKKKIDADKSMVYCPRTWCAAPARSKKYPPLKDISQLKESEDTSPADDKTKEPALESSNLCICEKCEYAFCRECKKSWHGELNWCTKGSDKFKSEDDQLTFDYIRKNTTECPSCAAPVQKAMGCNHMTCFGCRTHFCYLCSGWLDPTNPYTHFNTLGTECYHKLWVLEEGDDGNGNVQFGGARGFENDAVVFEELVAAAQNLGVNDGH
jgi:E3 ubiquitin-protein ligase RNF14